MCRCVTVNAVAMYMFRGVRGSTYRLASVPGLTRYAFTLRFDFAGREHFEIGEGLYSAWAQTSREVPSPAKLKRNVNAKRGRPGTEAKAYTRLAYA